MSCNKNNIIIILSFLISFIFFEPDNIMANGKSPSDAIEAIDNDLKEEEEKLQKENRKTIPIFLRDFVYW